MNFNNILKLVNRSSFDASLKAVQLEVASNSVVVPTTFTVSANGTTVTFTPAAPLTSGVQYKLVIGYPVSDVAGNIFNGYNLISTFTAQ